MPEINKPTEATYWVARNADGSVLHHGVTDTNQVTTTGQPTFVYDTEQGEQLAELSNYADQFSVLPDSGELQAGEIYRYGDELYAVRQSHSRTEHAPQDVPALFLWYRSDGSSTNWAAGEQVLIGTVRSHDGTDYKCIQAHVTQVGWEPPIVPALWQEVVDVPDVAEWVQPTGGHDAYAIGARVTYQGNTWESTINANVWAPGVFGWVQV